MVGGAVTGPESHCSVIVLVVVVVVVVCGLMSAAKQSAARELTCALDLFRSAMARTREERRWHRTDEKGGCITGSGAATAVLLCVNEDVKII